MAFILDSAMAPTAMVTESTAGMATGTIVDANEPVDPVIQADPGPLQLGDIVVHEATGGMHALADPVGFAERGDEESYPFLECDIYPFIHAPTILARRFFDQRVHTDRFVGQTAHQAYTFAVIVSVHVGERYRLQYAYTPGCGDRCSQLGIAARVHRPADHRVTNPGLTTEFLRGDGKVGSHDSR